MMDFSCSVIVPTFNRQHLIGATLDSILNQTLRPTEVIVVDDGSTDATAATIANYGANVRFSRIERSGVQKARNVGAALASQSWLLLCDSDDLWRPDYVAQVARLAHAASDVSFIFSNFVHVIDDAWVAADKFSMAPPGYWAVSSTDIFPGAKIINESLYNRLIEFQCVFPSCIAIRRGRYFELGGYDQRLAYVAGEDLEFALRCVQRPPFGVLDRPFVGIRRHSGNESANTLRQTLGEVEILRRVLDWHAPPATSRKIIYDEIQRRNISALDSAFANGDLDLVERLGSSISRPVLSKRQRAKIFVSRLPRSLRSAIRRGLLAISELNNSPGKNVP
jgi:glycosyltransferase involved in cell wall biosynthesis